MAENGKVGGVSAAQKRAIAALLSEPNIGKAAEKAAVGERTLHRWLVEDEAFKAALHEAQDRAIDAAVARLAGAAGDAAGVLADIAGDEEERGATRVSAARALLDGVLKMVEVRDLSARVAALEAKFQAGGISDATDATGNT